MPESGCQVKAQSRLRSFVAYLEMASFIRVYGAPKHSLCLFVFGHSPFIPHPHVACEDAIHFLSPLPLKGVLIPVSMDRVSVEVWQQILLKVMETSDWPIFATSCTPYTFLAFTYLHVSQQRDQKPYLDYLAQRGRLRLVCRVWNEFVLFTSHRWLSLQLDWSPMYELDSTTLIRTKGGVGPIKILSTAINSDESVTPILSWASHILKRPASQSPLRAYILHVDNVREIGPRGKSLDLLARTTTTQDPECTNTNTTLRSLSIIALCNSNISTSFSQISGTFTGLRSLFLHYVRVARQQTLTLAHLEVLYVQVSRVEWEELQQSIETWHTPALRHVRLGYFTKPLTNVIDRFLGRYAHQIESLVLIEYDICIRPYLDLSSGFWAQFPALCLLGLGYCTFMRKEWSGWSVVPPPTHPCRYLFCCFYLPVGCDVERKVGRGVDNIRPRWTWNDGVRLVVGDARSGQYYVVKNIRDQPSIANMERTVGILPEL